MDFMDGKTGIESTTVMLILTQARSITPLSSSLSVTSNMPAAQATPPTLTLPSGSQLVPPTPSMPCLQHYTSHTCKKRVANHRSHHQMSRERPIERCPECGNVLKMDYVGPQDDRHGHGHGHHDAHADGSHHYEGEPKTFADFVKPEYR